MKFPKCCLDFLLYFLFFLPLSGSEISVRISRAVGAYVGSMLRCWFFREAWAFYRRVDFGRPFWSSLIKIFRGCKFWKMFPHKIVCTLV